MPRQTREKGPVERRAHAAAIESGLRWTEVVDALAHGTSGDTLTRRLRDIDGGRRAFPYETAEQLLQRITKKCRLRADFFLLDFTASEEGAPVPDSFQLEPDHPQDAQDEGGHASG